MLDIKFIREHADEVKQNLVNRHNPFDLDKVLELDGKQNPRKLPRQRKMGKMLLMPLLP